MQGVALRINAWQPIFASDDGTAMSIVTLYGTEEGWRALGKNPELANKHDDMAALLNRSTMEIHKFWLDRRTAPTAPSVQRVKVGRN